MRICVLLLFLACMLPGGGCTPSPEQTANAPAAVAVDDNPPDGEDVPLPAPPWEQPPLAPSDVPRQYVEEWRKAENRATCAPIAPTSLGAGEGATPRRANFAGGWAVAYDLPDLRSAFGVAGAGVGAEDDIYDGWPRYILWSDGSRAGYGPEGGTGPNDLAFLQIAGQDCLYNVWSKLGVEHLEYLLNNLRFVDVAEQVRE